MSLCAPNPQNYEFVSFYGKRDLLEAIKIMNFEWEEYSASFRWAQSYHMQRVSPRYDQRKT